MEKFTSFPEITIEDVDQQEELKSVIKKLKNQVEQGVTAEAFQEKGPTLFDAVTITSQNLLINKIITDIEGFFNPSVTEREVYLDDPGYLADRVFCFDDITTRRLSALEVEEAKHIGKDRAVDAVVSHFEPEVNFSFGTSRLPFILWRNDLAEDYFLEGEKTNGGAARYSLPTRIPGVSVEFLYIPDERLPLRSLFLAKTF